MTDSQVVAKSSTAVNGRQVLVGSILIGLGGVVALAGIAMAGTAIVAAYRERIRQMDVPPSTLAKQNWDRVRAATAAGYAEFRDGRQPAEATAAS